jgi:hypothetical protein
MVAIAKIWFILKCWFKKFHCFFVHRGGVSHLESFNKNLREVFIVSHLHKTALVSKNLCLYIARDYIQGIHWSYSTFLQQLFIMAELVPAFVTAVVQLYRTFQSTNYYSCKTLLDAKDAVHPLPNSRKAKALHPMADTLPHRHRTLVQYRSFHQHHAITGTL